MKEQNTPVEPGRIVQVVTIGVFGALVTVGSYISFPLPLSPVPISLQTLFVLLGGIFLGPKRGTLAIALYLVLGIAGLPVFAQGTSGIGRILGPSGGYLIGFLLGAFLSGLVFQIIARPDGVPTTGTRRDQALRSIIGAGVAALVGTLGIYGIGVTWLKIVNDLNWELALSYGLIPFLLGDGIKILAAAALGPFGVKLFRQ